VAFRQPNGQVFQQKEAAQLPTADEQVLQELTARAVNAH